MRERRKRSRTEAISMEKTPATSHEPSRNVELIDDANEQLIYVWGFDQVRSIRVRFVRSQLSTVGSRG